MPAAAAFVGGMFSFGAGAAFTAGAATFGAWTAGAAFTGTLIGSLTVKLLTTVAVTALTQALAPEPPQGGGITIEATVNGEDNPETIILGRYATGGQAICAPYSHGDSNRLLTHVIELCSAPGATLERVMMGDDWVEFGTDPHPDYGLPVLGEYEGHVWVKYYDGSQTAPDPMLRDRYGNHPDRPWTADMVGTGICYAILTFYYDQEDFPQVPRYRFEMGGIPLYDIRRDTTAGGSGPHRLSNPSTWETSENPVVQAWNIMRGIRLPGGEVWGGNITDLRSLPTAVWIAAMNRCDVPIDVGADDTEPAYRAGLEIALNQAPASSLEELFKACSATIADLGYGWGITVGAPGLPVYSFTDADIVVSRTQELDSFPGLQDTFNAVSARFPHPRFYWETRESPLRTNAEWEASDAFGRRAVSLSLPAVPYPRQVQRLTRALARDNRRFARQVVSLPPDAAHVELIDTLSWSDARNGYDGKVFSAYEIAEDPRTGIRQFSLRERNPNDYSWEPGFELPTAPGPTSPTPRPPEQVSGFGVEGVVLEDPDGRGRRVGARLYWNSSISARGLRWQIRLAGRTVASLEGDTQNIALGELTTYAGILKDTSYEARARLILGRKTIWTDWLPFSTDSAGFSWDDFEAEVREAVDDAMAQANAAAQAAAETDAKADEIRADLTAAEADLTAGIQQARDDLGADIDAVQQLALDNLNVARAYTDTSVQSEAQVRQTATDALAAQIQTLTAVLNSENYIENPRFSNGTTGWTGTASATVVAQDDLSGDPIVADAPASFFASIPTSPSANQDLWQDFPVSWVESEVFQWRLYAATADAGRQARTITQWFDSGGAVISGPQTVIDLVQDEWRVYSGQLTPPAGAASVRFRLRVPTSAATAPVAFADVAFTKVDQSAIARIVDLETVVANNEAAQAAWNSAATARIDDNEGAITSEASTRATQDGVLSGRIDTVEAAAGSNAAAITAEATARADADAALAGQITSVEAVAGRSRTFRQSTEPTIPEIGDIWYDTGNGRQAYRWDGSSWSAVDDARIAQNAAAITSEATARANADSAMATQINTVSASANRARTFRQSSAPSSAETGDVWYDTSANSRPKRWSGTAWVDAGDTRIASLQATVTTQATAISDLAGNASAGYLIRAQAGGAVSLIDLIAADGRGSPTSVVKVQASDILLKGSVAADMLTVMDLSGNMVPDADMVSSASWGTDSDPNWGRLSPEQFNWSRGESAGEIRCVLTGSYTAKESQPFTVLQGVEYSFRGIIRAIGSSPASAQITVVWLDNNGDLVDPPGQQGIATLSDNTFVENNQDWVAPVGARKAVIRLRVFAGNQATVGFSSISCIRKRSGNTLITPGGVTADLVTAETMRALNGEFLNLAAANIRVGSGEIDSIHIKHLAVDNIHLTDGSVSRQWSKSSNWGRDLNISVPSPSKLIIGFSGICDTSNSLNGFDWYGGSVRIRLNGSVIADSRSLAIRNPNQEFGVVRCVNVPAGSHTISVETGLPVEITNASYFRNGNLFVFAGTK